MSQPVPPERCWAFLCTPSPGGSHGQRLSAEPTQLGKETPSPQRPRETPSPQRPRRRALGASSQQGSGHALLGAQSRAPTPTAPHRNQAGPLAWGPAGAKCPDEALEGPVCPPRACGAHRWRCPQVHGHGAAWRIGTSWTQVREAGLRLRRRGSIPVVLPRGWGPAHTQARSTTAQPCPARPRALRLRAGWRPSSLAQIGPSSALNTGHPAAPTLIPPGGDQQSVGNTAGPSERSSRPRGCHRPGYAACWPTANFTVTAT